MPKECILEATKVARELYQDDLCCGLQDCVEILTINSKRDRTIKFIKFAATAISNSLSYFLP